TRIVLLQQALALVRRQRQQLGQAPADPGGLVEPRFRKLHPDLADLGHDPAQHLAEQRVLRLQRVVRVGRAPRNLRHHQAVVADLRGEHVEPAPAAQAQLQQAIWSGAEILDPRRGAAGHRGRGAPDFAALRDQADAESAAAAPALAHQVEVARLEHAQVGRAAGDEHRVEREQGQGFGHGQGPDSARFSPIAATAACTRDGGDRTPASARRPRVAPPGPMQGARRAWVPDAAAAWTQSPRSSARNRRGAPSKPPLDMNTTWSPSPALSRSASSSASASATTSARPRTCATTPAASQGSSGRARKTTSSASASDGASACACARSEERRVGTEWRAWRWEADETETRENERTK